MNKNLENELREAYFTLWAAVENGIDTDTFFKLRETFRGIQSMVEEDDNENPYPEHSRIEAEGLADDEISEMQNFRPSNIENVRNCPCGLRDYQKEALDLMVRDGQSVILVLPTGVGKTISKKEMYQTKLRGSNDQEYQLYLDHADNGNGGDITNNNLPLKTYDEWLNS